MNKMFYVYDWTDVVDETAHFIHGVNNLSPIHTAPD